MSSRACVFINSNDPRVRNKLINPISCIKPPFPPKINLRELITKQTFDDKSSGRSPNAFIIYRKAFVEAARKDGYQLPMTVVSSMASRSWLLESDLVKEEYKKLAKEANAIRNKLIPRNKKRRQKWNIVSFPPPPTNSSPPPPPPPPPNSQPPPPNSQPPPPSTKPTIASSASASDPTPAPAPSSSKTKIKRKKVETKEISTPTNFIPPLFHIPYDICSKIEDRYKSLNDSAIDNPPFITNSTQQQEDFNFADFNNFNNYIPQIDIQSHNQDLIIEEQMVASININNEFEYDSFGFPTFFNEHGVYYPSLWTDFSL